MLVLGLGVVIAVAALRWRGEAATNAAPAVPVGPPPVASPPDARAAPPEPAQDPAKGLRAEIRVVDEHGGPVQHFELTLLLAKQSLLGYARIPDLPARTVQPAEFRGDHLLVSDLPEGSLVAVVEAAPYTRTFSEPFAVTTGKPAPKVMVRLERGSEVTGTVLGNDRVPVQGATVRIEPDTGLPTHSPLAELFASMASDVDRLFTTATTPTDAAGRFRFTGVVSGKYALMIDHPSYCRHETGGMRVGGGATLDAPQFVLMPGTIVEGVVRGIDGKPAEGIEVVVTRLDPGPRVEGPTKVTRESGSKAWKALSGEGGAFRMAVRLPPGNYQIHPACPPGGNPLLLIQQIQKSTQTFEIAPGADKIGQHVTLSW